MGLNKLNFNFPDNLRSLPLIRMFVWGLCMEQCFMEKFLARQTMIHTKKYTISKKKVGLK